MDEQTIIPEETEEQLPELNEPEQQEDAPEEVNQPEAHEDEQPEGGQEGEQELPELKPPAPPAPPAVPDAQREALYRRVLAAIDAGIARRPSPPRIRAHRRPHRALPMPPPTLTPREEQLNMVPSRCTPWVLKV